MGLDTIEFVMEIEAHFGVHLQDAEWQALKTVGDLRDRIAAHLARMDCGTVAARDVGDRRLRREPGRWYRADGTIDAGAVWEDVKVIVSYQFGVDAREITPQIRFVEDLCC